MADPADAVQALAVPIAERHGVEVLSVDVKVGGGSGLVRVIVDAKGGAPLSVCQDVSRELSRRLDEADPIEGRYALEVSSPGIDWPLRDQRDFDRIEGRDVDVCFKVDGDSVTQVGGTVVAAGADDVELRTADGNRRVPYDVIVWAKQALPW